MLKINRNAYVCQHVGVCVETLPVVFKIMNGNLIIDSSTADNSARPLRQ